ncbi:LysE family translocator [Nonomuraea sp. ATR24]|uniref:LysE family translocator n=1 Tax=Nonomuraea TaxID=83681 RepID=UPI001C5EE8EB|nr:LysE family translocator [Nonomuraea ceibae]
MDIAGFALVVALLTVTPGLDTALILRTSLLAGRRPAWGVALGVQLGVLVWGLVSVAGLSTLLAASQFAYDVLRWAGAAYLVWMGLRLLFVRKDAHVEAPAEREVRFRTGFRRGLVTNLLNPKVGAFYVAMLPQFLPSDQADAASGLLLAGVHVAEGLVWSGVLIAFAAVMGGLLRAPAVRRLLDRVTGVVIVGFGVRLAVE